MGYDYDTAEEATYRTGGRGVEAAVEWLSGDSNETAGEAFLPGIVDEEMQRVQSEEFQRRHGNQNPHELIPTRSLSGEEKESVAPLVANARSADASTLRLPSYPEAARDSDQVTVVVHPEPPPTAAVAAVRSCCVCGDEASLDTAIVAFTCGHGMCEECLVGNHPIP